MAAFLPMHFLEPHYGEGAIAGQARRWLNVHPGAANLDLALARISHRHSGFAVTTLRIRNSAIDKTGEFG